MYKRQATASYFFFGLDRNGLVCNNILELASNPSTVFNVTELHSDPTYDVTDKFPDWMKRQIKRQERINKILRWYQDLHWGWKLGVGIALLIGAIGFTVATGGGGAGVISVLVQTAIGVGVGVGLYTVGSLLMGTFTWEGLANAALDAFLITSAMVFISSAVNAIKYACRGKPISTAELKSVVNNKTAVIGKMDDLNAYKLQPGEFKVADLLPNKGSVRANWKQNSSVLRKIMKSGNPIRDVSVIKGQLVKNTGFLAMERNLLLNHGLSLIHISEPTRR